jgi:ribosomal protein S18 acetylase RimI-like enzyme
MQVVEYRSELLPSLTRLINEQMASIPPQWSFSEAQVALTIEQAASLWGMHYPDDHELYRAQTLCVLHRREVVAAAQWLLPQHQREVCSICWLVAHPDRPTALQTLLHLLEKQAGAGGCHLITCGRSSFGVGWFGIPATWKHVFDGMCAAGFNHTETWMLLHGRTSAYDSAPLIPNRMKLYWDMNRPALEWTLSAYASETVIGECQVWGIPDHLEACAGFNQWATIEWIEVNGEYQRRGIGKRLIAEQMRFHGQRGIEHFAAWVRQGNHSARRLHESMGFQYGPELTILEKRLNATPGRQQPPAKQLPLFNRT